MKNRISLILFCCTVIISALIAKTPTETLPLLSPKEWSGNRTVYYTGQYTKTSAFIIISKRDLCLSVYAPVGVDTFLLARYPVCMGANKGQKLRKGDHRTPESSMQHPFTISQIQPSGKWKHNFGDGRGMIHAYGDWFLRLSTPPFKSIGIHGSTNNEATVPGRQSEGCIRLLDSDIVHLKENYAYVGMPVIVKKEQQGLLSFEKF